MLTTFLFTVALAHHISFYFELSRPGFKTRHRQKISAVVHLPVQKVSSCVKNTNLKTYTTFVGVCGCWGKTQKLQKARQIWNTAQRENFEKLGTNLYEVCLGHKPLEQMFTQHTQVSTAQIKNLRKKELKNSTTNGFLHCVIV